MDIFITLVTLAICVAIVVKANNFLTVIKTWHTEMSKETTELLEYCTTYRQTLLDASERIMNLNKSSRAYEITLENLANDYRAALAENARLKEEISERAQELDDAEVELRETKRALAKEDGIENFSAGSVNAMHVTPAPAAA